MKISARNVLKGKGKRIVHGSVNSEVSRTSGWYGDYFYYTKNSVENLDLKEGHEVYAVIKATSVMLVSD